jgi:hypothetical protein
MASPPLSDTVCSDTSDSSQQTTFALVVITNSEVRQNDVLCGRGQGMYNHHGNGYFRQLVEQRRHLYLDAAPYKCDKRLISGEIVHAIHNLNPPGRFLARLSGRKRRQQGRQVSDITWYEVSYDKAREKACQSLRERAPPLSAKKAINCAVEVDSGRRNTARPQRTSELSAIPAIVLPNTSNEVNAARATTSVSPVPDSTFTKEEIDLLISISEHPLPPSLPSARNQLRNKREVCSTLERQQEINPNKRQCPNI